MTHYTDERLQDAIIAARAGQREEAQTLLQEIVAEDPANVDAWVWLGAVEVDPAAQYRALERAVALDPQNQRAKQGLEWLDRQYPNLSLGTASDEGVAVGDGVMDDDPFREDDLSPPPGADPELRCPYCGEWTNVTDTSCQRCQYPLIMDAGRSMGATMIRWLLALLWLGVGVAAGFGSYWALGEAGRLRAGTSKIALSVVALGGAPPLGDALPPAMLLQLINGTVVATVLLALLGVIFTLGMVFRWRAVYVLQILILLLLIVSAGALSALLWNGGRLELDAVRGYNADVLVLWVLGPALIGFAAALLMTLACRREFFPQRVRVRIPDEAVSPRDHFRRGKQYEGRGWLWASAREYERAVEQKPDDKRYGRALNNVYEMMGDDGANDANGDTGFDLGPSERDPNLVEESERRER